MKIEFNLFGTWNILGLKIRTWIILMIISVACGLGASTVDIDATENYEKIVSVSTGNHDEVFARVKDYSKTIKISAESYEACKPTCFVKVRRTKNEIEFAFLLILSVLAGFLGFFTFVDHMTD